MTEYNVFSAFNGIGCAAYVLEKLGYNINKYYAAEIDPRANFIATKNYPKTIHYGDITKIKSSHFMSPINFMCGGSPCQDLSIAGNMAGINGSKSKLFFEFVRLKNEFQKAAEDAGEEFYFFFENVRCKKQDKDIITEKLGVEPIYFDSAITSAQTRKRLYWTNIVSIADFVYPEDKKITLLDIIEYFGNPFFSVGGKFKPTVKANTIDANYHKGLGANQTRTCVQVGNTDCSYEKQSRVYSPIGKSPAIDTQSGGGRGVKVANMVRQINPSLESGGKQPYQQSRCYDVNFKYPAIATVNPPKVITYSSQPRNGKGNGGKGHLQKEDGKAYCIDTTCTTMIEYADTYRKLTPIEVERCFSLPDNYTKGISTSARYHGLGNGWEAATIEHFFNYLPK